MNEQVSSSAQDAREGAGALPNPAEFARRVRINSLAELYLAGSGHPGGALSAADILAVVFSRAVQRGTLSGEMRDRFVLSKGHSCPALYAAGAEVGLLPHAELAGLRKLGSPLQGHPHVGKLPWVETSTGSLGQGFSVAVGMALGLRFTHNPGRVTVMLGDGELQEGEVWEAAMFAAHHRLANLCAIVDYNRMQSDDINDNIVRLEPLADKWRAFNWHTLECDGHDTGRIAAALDAAEAETQRPTVIIAHTLKGKGVSYMEGSPLWHGSVKLSADQLRTALGDLGVPADLFPAYLDGSVWANEAGEVGEAGDVGEAAR
jgi:transketolase